MPRANDIAKIKNTLSENEMNELLKRIKNHEVCCNLPKDSALYQIQLKENDLVILGTDGLFDNVFK